MFKNSLFILIVVFLLSSCKPNKQEIDHSTPDSTAIISYASGFMIDYFPSYKRLTVLNPWIKNTVYARYYLVSGKEVKTPTDGQEIQIPIKSIGCASGTHYEFLQLIGELQSIQGICSPKLIYNETLRAKFKQNKLVDMGDPFSLQIEKVQLLQPDAIMVSGFNQEDPISKRLIENGIPVIFNNEWTETSLLARAEWIKFVAAFYNKEKLANSLFTKMAQSYEAIKYKAIKKHKKPSVMVGGNFKGTWYMPGGKSYMTGLLQDAGASYFYAADTTTGSLALNFEVALNNFKNADVWIGSSANSLSELLQIDERHGLFQPIAKKQVYNFNKRMTTSGGNDFWESGVAHPDIILKDMIKVFYPEKMAGHEFVYVRKLE